MVSEEELERQRKLFVSGQLELKIEQQTFDMKCANPHSLLIIIPLGR